MASAQQERPRFELGKRGKGVKETSAIVKNKKNQDPTEKNWGSNLALVYKWDNS